MLHLCVLGRCNVRIEEWEDGLTFAQQIYIYYIGIYYIYTNTRIFEMLSHKYNCMAAELWGS